MNTSVNAKILNKILANWIQRYIKKDYFLVIKWDLFLGCKKKKKRFNIHKSINVIYHINKLNDKNHITISMDTEKAFEKYNIFSW